MIFSESAPDIWSLSRKYRRSFCPRSAILRYREAPRAREEDASEIAVRAYACGKKISDSKFLREIMLGVLRREFYAGETDPARLDGVVSEAFHLEYRKLIYGRSDRQLFSLCREPDFEGKCRELEHLLTTYPKPLIPHCPDRGCRSSARKPGEAWRFPVHPRKNLRRAVPRNRVCRTQNRHTTENRNTATG